MAFGLVQLGLAAASLRDADLAWADYVLLSAMSVQKRSADEVIDLVQGGQGVFGIAVGRVWREIEGELPNYATRKILSFATFDAEARITAERPAARAPSRVNSRAAA